MWGGATESDNAVALQSGCSSPGAAARGVLLVGAYHARRHPLLAGRDEGQRVLRAGGLGELAVLAPLGVLTGGVDVALTQGGPDDRLDIAHDLTNQAVASAVVDTGTRLAVDPGTDLQGVVLDDEPQALVARTQQPQHVLAVWPTTAGQVMLKDNLAVFQDHGEPIQQVPAATAGYRGHCVTILSSSVKVRTIGSLNNSYIRYGGQSVFYTQQAKK